VADPRPAVADPRPADVELFFDPVCPFCWVTARWLWQVERLADVRVGWRFISLAMLNDRPGAYDDKPAAYPEVHGLGRRLLRVAAAAREQHGPAAVARAYRAFGEALWERDVPGVADFDDILEVQARGIDVAAALAAADLPTSLASAVDDEHLDAALAADTKEALARVGDDVGTPILSFAPPDGPAFFGPVLSDLPEDEDAVDAFEALRTLAGMPGFAEVKRTLRSVPVTALTRPLVGDTLRVS
jgi:hypothetical protein